jgi:hypothetical protein
MIYWFGTKYQEIENGIRKFTISQINKEKNNRKYIPKIFIETVVAKEKLRYFSQPYRFYSKVIYSFHTNIKNSSFISALENLHYPVPPLHISPKMRSTNLKENCQDLIDAVDHYIKPSDILADEHDDIKKEHFEKIPINKQHLYYYQRYKFHFFGYYDRIISDFKKDLRLFVSQTILLVSKAGYGKTNLICDFTENFLLKKSKICLYFTGRDFNQMADTESIEEAISRIIFIEKKYRFSDIISLLSFKKINEYVYIVIDGINEQNDLVSFSLSLEQFIQRCNNLNIKIILTCRSEYFQERFGNLENLEDISIVYMDELKIPETHRKYLIDNYFSFFDIPIKSSQVSDDVIETFSEDKLLLRFFCEAYQGERNVPPLYDLYRLEIFTHYLVRNYQKIIGLEDCLKEIILYMIDNQKLSDIPYNALSNETKQIIESATYENLLIRKDIVINPDIAFSKNEVINFVYDEFRDFLLASYLIILWSENKSKAKDRLDKLAGVKNIVAEGLQKYLCLWAIKNSERELLRYLSSFNYFSDAFINSIFESSENVISEEDLALLKNIFLQNQGYAILIITKLLYRCDVIHYPILNINFLFEQITEMNDSQYNDLVITGLQNQYDFQHTYITSICTDIIDAFLDRQVSKEIGIIIIKLLIYLSGVKDELYRDRMSAFGLYPAIEAFSRIKDNFRYDELQVILEQCYQSTRISFIRKGIEKILDGLKERT